MRNMKYVKQFALIALMTFLGECLNRLLPLPVPASIYGMLLLFACLQTGLIKLSQIEETADFFLAVMPLCFISPTVSLMVSIGLIKGSLLGILGMLIGVPIAAAFYRLLKEDIRRREQRK